ncbi:MAG: hypothetical protein V7641_291 [Blastocatellia bacterium]
MALTQGALDLLLAHFDPDRERAAEKYEIIRKKLIKFFEWQRCDNADACADEAIDRVAKRIDTGTQVGNLEKYINGVARLIALEVFRERERKAKIIRQMVFPATSNTDAENEGDQSRFHCMQECLSRLSRKSLELMVRYHQFGNKKENRIKLAEQMNIQLNALRLRVHKIRGKLRKCYIRCLLNEPD